MNERPFITLTTDFGLENSFVGVMKGIILSVTPGAGMVDLTHAVERHDIREAAWVIGDSYGFFPEGTIHLVVVDPGVGGDRRAIAVRADGHLFVGPDNGVFTIPLQKKGGEVRELTKQEYHRAIVSQTFAGRDVFAPVAAHLAAGVALESLGGALSNPVTIPLPEPQSVGAHEIVGEIIYFDRFGNAMTNIAKSMLPQGKKMIISFDLQHIDSLSTHYAAADGLGAIIGSQDRLELFVINGAARDEFDLGVGKKVTVTF